jgi:hypothetical protein|tara:strand:+ start:809 stop:1135 length:327 start_codon:yes stop_codon:yes gene_type:complete
MEIIMSEIFKEPKFKKTPRERKKEKKKGYGYEKGDFEIPTIGVLGGGMSVAAGAAYDKAKKLEKKYKEEDEEKNKEDEDSKITGREGSFKKGGLVRSGKPKLAKKGWK